jgi:hypothetical protein
MICAEDVTGLKPYTEITELHFIMQLVAERSVSRRRCSVKNAGGIRSENADMSSEKKCERHFR